MRRAVAPLLLCLSFGLLALWIHPEYPGDPIIYGSQAWSFLQHPGRAETRGIWEFGHLVWRPLAVALTPPLAPLLARLRGLDPELAPLAVLKSLSFLFTLVTALLGYRTARALSHSTAVGFAVGLALLASYPMLLYEKTGCTYSAGAAMQFLAVTLIVAPPAKPLPGWLRAGAIGGAVAASICIWVPFVVSAPGILAFAAVWCRDRGLRLAVHSAVWAFAFTALAFVFAIWVNGFRSVPELAQWVRASSHSVQQNRRILRLATGLPRSLIELQGEALPLKRFAFHDPYAPVTLPGVLLAVALKPLFFLAAMAALGWILARTPEGRRLLFGVLCCWIPAILFSVLVFEPSEPERGVPAYALLFAALGYAGGRLSKRDPAAWVLAAFFVFMAGANAVALSPAAGARIQSAAPRLEAYRSVWRPNSSLVLLSHLDPVMQFWASRPFDPLNRIPFRFLEAVAFETSGASRYREQFANETLQAWQNGGDMWISRRLLAARPEPQWGWVEGDDPSVRWADVSAFFRQFSTDAFVGGEDGFLRIRPDGATGDALRTLGSLR